MSGAPIGTEELCAELDKLRRHHHVSPDCWYTCPACNRPDSGYEERCCNDTAERGDLTCDCGADEHNARIDSLLERLRA